MNYEKLLCKDSLCPICSTQMNIHMDSGNLISTSCKNECYGILKSKDDLMANLNIFNKDFYFFPPSFSLSKREEMSMEVMEKINAWKKGDKYLLQILNRV